MAIQPFTGASASSRRTRSRGRGGSSSRDITVDELLIMARMQGGAVGQIAEELTHPKTSILSTIGQGFKNTFKEFVDIVSTPSHIVAGALSKDLTIGDAMRDNTSVSDVILGEGNIFDKGGDPSTLSKIGNFAVRLPIDILTDPTTYLTFGASAGFTGLKSLGKVSLGKAAAQEFGEKAGKEAVEKGFVTKSLTQKGQDVESYLRAYKRQIDGTYSAEEFVKKGKELGRSKAELIASGATKESVDQSEAILKGMIKDTVEAPLDIDLAKKTMSKLFENNPALVREYIDRGGIKMFGKTMLSSQRIDSVKKMIPGMTMLDNVLTPVRNAVLAPFDPALVKVDNGYMRLPEEFVGMKTKMRNLGESMGVDLVRNLSNVQKNLNLNQAEMDIVTSALTTKKIPADPRLAKAYLEFMGINEDQLKMIRASGKTIHNLEGQVGLIYNPVNTKKIKINSGLSRDIGAAQEAQHAKFIPVAEKPVIETSEELKNILGGVTKQVDEVTDSVGIEAKKYKSAEEFIKAQGEQVFHGSPKKIDNLDDIDFKKGLYTLKRTAGDIAEQTKYLNDPYNNKITKLSRIKEEKLLTPKEIDEWEQLLENPSRSKKLDDRFAELAAKAGKQSRIKEGLTVEKELEDYLKDPARAFGENVSEFVVKFKKPLVVDFKGKGWMSKDEFLYDLTSEEIPKALKNGNDGVILKNIREGFSAAGVRGDAAGLVDDYIVLDKSALKTKSQLEQIWKEANTGTVGGVNTSKLPPELMEKISKAKSLDDVGRIIGDEVDKIVKGSKDNVEGGLKNTEELRKLRDAVDALPRGKQLIGRTDKLGVKEIDAEKYLELGLDETEGRYFINNEKQIYKRVATTAQELKEVGIEGFDTNLFTAMTARGMQNINQALGQHFAEGLVRNFSKFADEAPESWVSLSSAITDEKIVKMYGNILEPGGREVVFHPAIAKNFSDMLTGSAGDEVSEGFWKSYDKLLSYWKGSVTTIFPMFHGRNAISNVFLNMLDLGVEAFNPKSYGVAADMVMKDRKLNSIMTRMKGFGDDAAKATKEFGELNQTKMFTDATGYDWTFKELHSVARDNGIAFNPNLTGPLDIRNDKEGLARYFGLNQESKAKRNLQKINPLNQEQFLPMRAGRELGTTIEEHSRMINFMANLRKTGDVAHAASRTKQFLFDYANLTPFEKNTMRRLIPFYTFTRKNLELQAKTFMTSPGRISAQIKTTKAIGDILGGEELTEEESKLLPSWLKNSLNLKTKTVDGKTQILTGFGTPLEQPFQQFGGSQIEGSLSPIIKIPLEKLTGYDFFRGKPISSVIDAKNFENAPEPVKQFIGYTKYEGVTSTGAKYVVQNALRPERMHSINSLPFVGRIMATLNSLTDEDVPGGLRALQGITGIRMDDIDFERQKELKDLETIQALEKMLKDAGIRGQFTRGYNRKNTTILE